MYICIRFDTYIDSKPSDRQKPRMIFDLETSTAGFDIPDVPVDMPVTSRMYPTGIRFSTQELSATSGH